jgi:hypothetical protein
MDFTKRTRTGFGDRKRKIALRHSISPDRAPVDGLFPWLLPNAPTGTTWRFDAEHPIGASSPHFARSIPDNAKDTKPSSFDKGTTEQAAG